MRHVLLGAALATVTVLTPASADPRSGGGLTCGLVATADPTGREDSVTAVLDGGPWFAPHRAPEAVVQITCTVQVEYPNQPPEFVTSASGTGAGTAVLGPTIASFLMGPGATIALCTQVTIYDQPPPYVYNGDADADPSNGAQCAKSPPRSGGMADVVVIPPQPDGGEVCVTVQHPYYPPVPRGACPPI